jgi:uncharacterized protein YdiU (UPF0061 family)
MKHEKENAKGKSMEVGVRCQKANYEMKQKERDATSEGMEDAGKEVIKRLQKLLQERNREHQATISELRMTQDMARRDRETAMKQIKVLRERLRKEECERYMQKYYEMKQQQRDSN